MGTLSSDNRKPIIDWIANPVFRRLLQGLFPGSSVSEINGSLGFPIRVEEFMRRGTHDLQLNATNAGDQIAVIISSRSGQSCLSAATVAIENMYFSSLALKRIVGLTLVMAVGFPVIGLCQSPVAPAVTSTVQSGLIDVDAMAARMVTKQDIYKKIRDEALSGYAKRNPTPTPNDDKIKTVIRILAYLWVWGDFYGEGLWQHGANYAHSVISQGTHEQVLMTFLDIKELDGYYSGNEAAAEERNRSTDKFLEGDFPSEFKLWACQNMVCNLTKFGSYEHPDPKAPSMQALPHFVEQWGQNYRELLKRGLPHDMLYWVGDSLQESAKDEKTLYLVIAEQDRDFNEIDPKNPVKLELDGNFYIKDAWLARGSDYANTVSDEGWKLFGERLAKADEILEPIYAQYPNETGTCHSMMTVELGQGQGRDRMELWFQRAIKANPNDFGAYKSKEWYLLPRWYGSVDDIMAFGQECVQTGNWAAKLPMILPIGISESSDGDQSLYARPEIWTAVEKTYRDYLAHYPNSIFYRTNFAKHAADGGHLDVAREQIKILGNDWDHAVLSEADYAALVAKFNSN